MTGSRSSGTSCRRGDHVITVTAKHEMRIATEDDIIAVRRRVRDIAELRKFDTFETAAITTATSELARNALVHGGKGVAYIEEVSDGQRSGIRIAFVDEGPGIPDVDRVLRGGYSTARSMGLGLSGSKRLVDEFALESEPDKGTKVTVLKWKRF
jgi:serine/threonine-protein kinase RsbT